MYNRISGFAKVPLFCGRLMALALALSPGEAAATYAAAPSDAFNAVIRQELARLNPPGDETVAALKDWYSANEYQPLWVGPAGANGKAQDFIEILKDAGHEGLKPGDYPAKEIEARINADPADGEVLLSRAFVHYISDLRTGRLSPRKVDPALFVQPGEIDREAILQAAREAHGIKQAVERFTPANPIYRRLRRVLAEYRDIADKGGWPSVPEGPSLKPGMRDDRVAALRARLMATKDLVYAGDDPALYDEALTQAVERFQARHGLEADGVVGRQTIAELNVPVQHRIEQIIVNMERWRWMPDDLGERYILVNLAGFEMDVVESGAMVMNMRVIAGKPYRRTPVFSSDMTYLEFNPTWTVPPTIAKHDILPKLRQDAGYLGKNDIRVFLGWQENAAQLAPSAIDWNAVDPKRIPYRFRQDPGPNNALGRVKFMFPNRFDVYLHDTPSRELFSKRVRSFSSGCVRVERPLELAEYLTRDLPGWNRRHIEEVIASRKTTVVRLARPVPVHLTYSTVWIGEGGTIHFRDDIYARDDLLFQALFGYPPARKQVPQDR
jgi:murein L,D-transpeptidase YcbB/YkuD